MDRIQIHNYKSYIFFYNYMFNYLILSIFNRFFFNVQNILYRRFNYLLFYWKVFVRVRYLSISISLNQLCFCLEDCRDYIGESRSKLNKVYLSNQFYQSNPFLLHIPYFALIYILVIPQIKDLFIMFIYIFNQSKLIMPLYEMIMITKCTPANSSAALLKNLTKFICNRGGNVRQVKILSDRLLAKQMKTINRQTSLIGRYTQILFDGSPITMNSINKQFRLDKNVLKISFFKIKDFYKYAQQYNRPLQDSQIKQDHPKTDIARKIAILKEEGF